MSLWFSQHPDSEVFELYEWCEEALLPPTAPGKETLSQLLTVVFFPQYTGRSEQCSSVYCSRAVITCVNRRNNNPSQKHGEEMKETQLSWTNSETRLGASEQDHTKGAPCSLLLFKTWAAKDTADGNWDQHPPTALTKRAQLSTAPCYHKSLDLCDLMVIIQFLT